MDNSNEQTIVGSDGVIDLSLDVLEKAIDYKFKDRSLLKEAITHCSVKAENGVHVKTNVRLELLGDSILGFLVSDYLYRKYPEANKSNLTDKRKLLVSNDALNRLGFARGESGSFLYDLMIKGGSIEHNNNRAVNMVADTVESIIAAIYLDRGLESARAFVMEMIVGDIDCLGVK